MRNCQMRPASRRMMLLLLTTLSLLLPMTDLATRVGAATPADAPPTSGAVPRFEPGKCPFVPGDGQVEGSTVICGAVVVPEMHANPDGRTIRIAVAQFKSRSQTPAAEPIVYLEGGPGGASLDGGMPDFAARFTQQ